MYRAKPSKTGQSREYEGLAFVGGHPGLDFLNTVKYRGAAECGDRLVEFSDIARWAYNAGLLNDRECQDLLGADDSAPHCRKLHREICAFREAARVVLDPGFHANRRFDKTARIVENAISRLRPVARIDRETGALVLEFPIEEPHDLKARIVASLSDLIARRPDLTIKTCGGHDCDWVFVDGTKAKRRKWCDTRTCGNSARVRRHRAEQNRK